MSSVDILTEGEVCVRTRRARCVSSVDIECGIAIQKVGSVKSADEEGEVCVRC